MSDYVSVDHRRAVDLMSEAREILFHQLHQPEGVCIELAEGVERLGLAFEFAENPRRDVVFCPECECFCLEELADGQYQCLSCDHAWVQFCPV